MMECPHCGYDEYEKKSEQLSEKFYELEVSAQRRRTTPFGYGWEKVGVYACPKCRKVFIEET